MQLPDEITDRPIHMTQQFGVAVRGEDDVILFAQSGCEKAEAAAVFRKAN